MGMTAASAEYFERVAGRWDELRAGYFGNWLRDAALATAYLRPEAVVADVGTGTGFMAAGLAPLVKQVYALDGSPAMLAVAQQNLGHFTNVVYQATDGANLPLADASVDAVFANMYLHHCPDPASAIREMMRIVKPGGRLVITDMDRHDQAWLREEMADEWLGFERGEIKAWLREAGLVNLLIDSAGQPCCAQSTANPGAEAAIGVFVATGSRRVTGAGAAVQANYAAVAEGGNRGCCSGAASATLAPAAPAASTCCASSPDAAAEAATSSCCMPAATTNAMPDIEAASGAAGLAWITGYSPEQLAAVPAEAASLSLGCGNPTALAGLRPGETVLDIGSGAGIDAFYAARRVGPAGKVIGLDMTPAMIATAQRSAAAAGLSQVEFRLGNAEQMPVADGTVDVVLSNCVINLCEDKGKVFEEAYRVLAAGGRLSISDMVSDRPFPLSWRSDPTRWAGCVNGALPETEYLDLLEHAGFQNIRAHRSASGGEVEGIHVYSLAVSARKGPLPAGVTAVGNDTMIPLARKSCCG